MKKRVGTIDLFRFVFIIGIVFFHFFAANMKLTAAKYFNFGMLGVEFFFIVSGFLLALKADREKEPNIGLATGRMTRGRFLSLMPYVVPAFLISFILRFILQKWTLATLGENVLTSYMEMLGLQMAGFRGDQPTQVYWYVSCLLIVGLIYYPLMLKFRSLFRRWAAPLIAVMVYGFLFYKTESVNDNVVWFSFIYKGLLRGLAGMAVGVAVYELKLWLDKEENPHRLGVGFAEIFGYIAAMYIAFVYRGTYLPVQFLFVVLIAPSIAISFSSQSALGKVFNGKFYTVLGELSTCIFLNHNYLTKWLPQTFPDLKGAALWATLFGGVAVCTTIAFFSGKLLKKLIKNGRSVFGVMYGLFAAAAVILILGAIFGNG